MKPTLSSSLTKYEKSLPETSEDLQSSFSELSSLEGWRIPLKWQGALWKILACACFAVLNGIVRYLTGGAGSIDQPLSPYEITFWQNVFGFLLMFPWIYRKTHSFFPRKWVFLHALRILVAVSGIIFLYFAFACMPITQAVALGVTGPVFTVIGARIYLKEKITVWRFLGIAFGFVGIFIIMRPDKTLLKSATDPLGWKLFLPLLSAIAFAMAKLLGRRLGMLGEKPSIMTTYLLLFTAPVSLIPALFYWTTPSLEQFIWLFLLGGVASLAHYSMAKAYTLAEITFVTPFGISRLIFTALVGLVAFAEVPLSLSLWIGAGAIILSSICLSLEEKRPQLFARR